MSKLKPCPVCGSKDISIYVMTQYRPKESMGKCSNCQYFVPLKGSQVKKTVNEWNAHVTLLDRKKARLK